MRRLGRVDIIRRIEALLDNLKNKNISLNESLSSINIDYATKRTGEENGWGIHKSNGDFFINITIAGYDATADELREK